MKYFYTTLIALVICSSFSFANMGEMNQSFSELTIQVINQTENGTPVVNDEVSLQIFQHQEVYGTLEGVASEDGKVIFENVPIGAQFIALPRAKHNNMMFTGQPVRLDPAEDKLDGQVEVFDVSTDKSKLFAQIHHIIIKTLTETNVLQITESMQLVNPSDRAITSDERDTQGNAIVLNLSLPKGFRNLQWSSYFEENAIVVTDSGFYDIMAIPPGSHGATFSYTLDISASTMDIVKKTSVPTERLIVMGQDVQLSGPKGMEKQTRNMGGIPTEILDFGAITPSEMINFQITGLTFDKPNWTTWIVLASVFVIMIIAAIVRSGTGKGNAAKKN